MDDPRADVTELPEPSLLLPDHVARLLEAGVTRRTLGYRGRFALPHGCAAPRQSAHRPARLARGPSPEGEWLLRIDDLDTPRNRPGAEEGLLADLRWLGLLWDGPPLRQSRRRGLYATVLSALRRGGALYPCRCSRRMLADISAPHGPLSVYPGSCRRALRQWGRDQGRLPSWRFRLPPGVIQWDERFAAPGRLDGPAQVGDTVLRRADGVIAYHLATAVDELALGISNVLRGQDLWLSTAPQVAVMAALGWTPPPMGTFPSGMTGPATDSANGRPPRGWRLTGHGAWMHPR